MTRWLKRRDGGRLRDAMSTRSERTYLNPLSLVVSFLLVGASQTVSALDEHAKLPMPLAMNDVYQVTLGLVLVLGAIAATAWIVRRFFRFHPGIDGQLKVICGVSIGPRERVLVVQAGSTQLVLGVAPGRVQTLHVLEQPINSPRAEHSEFSARTMPFANVLKRIRSPGKHDA